MTPRGAAIAARDAGCLVAAAVRAATLAKAPRRTIAAVTRCAVSAAASALLPTTSPTVTTASPAAGAGEQTAATPEAVEALRARRRRRRLRIVARRALAREAKGEPSSAASVDGVVPMDVRHKRTRPDVGAVALLAGPPDVLPQHAVRLEPQGAVALHGDALAHGMQVDSPAEVLGLRHPVFVACGGGASVPPAALPLLEAAFSSSAVPASAAARAAAREREIQAGVDRAVAKAAAIASASSSGGRRRAS